MAIDFGTVKFFDVREHKMYGFISTADGEPDIWFHFNDARKLEAQDEEVVFVNETPAPSLKFPRIGEFVVFERGKGRDGRLKACPWNSLEQHEEAMRILRARATEDERNADLYEKAALVGWNDQDGLLSYGLPDTVFTDHASDSDDDE